MKLRQFYALVVLGIHCVVVPFIWWLSGYDFDHRGPDVAFTFAMSVLWTVFVTCWVYAAPVSAWDEKL